MVPTVRAFGEPYWGDVKKPADCGGLFGWLAWDRTTDLSLIRGTLYRLSYRPEWVVLGHMRQELVSTGRSRFAMRAWKDLAWG